MINPDKLTVKAGEAFNAALDTARKKMSRSSMVEENRGCADTRPFFVVA